MVVRADLPSLVTAARGGDGSAYGEVVEACWNDLVGFARSLVGNADAEDIVQECLVHAWRELPKLKDPDRFRPWVTTAVYRRALRWKRWWWWRREPLADPAPDARAAATEERLDVARLLGHLTRRQRAVLHLTVVEGMSDTEIAKLLSMAPGTVRAHRRRARETLARIPMERRP